jgi:hypothetical protein
MPTTSHTSLIAAADIRQRRMDAAAHHRQVRMARASRRRNAEPRGEPTRVLFRLYHLPRWLVTS